MNFWSFEYDTTGSRHLHSLTGVFLKQHGIHKEHHLRCFFNRPSYNTNFILSTAFRSVITNKLLLFLFVVHTFVLLDRRQHESWPVWLVRAVWLTLHYPQLCPQEDSSKFPRWELRSGQSRKPGDQTYAELSASGARPATRYDW